MKEMKTRAFSDAITSQSHKEVDPVIPLHVIDAYNQIPHSSVDVRSPDTDLSILVLHLCTQNQLQDP